MLSKFALTPKRNSLPTVRHAEQYQVNLIYEDEGARIRCAIRKSTIDNAIDCTYSGRNKQKLLRQNKEYEQCYVPRENRSHSCQADHRAKYRGDNVIPEDNIEQQLNSRCAKWREQKRGSPTQMHSACDENNDVAVEIPAGSVIQTIDDICILDSGS